MYFGMGEDRIWCMRQNYRQEKEALTTWPSHHVTPRHVNLSPRGLAT